MSEFSFTVGEVVFKAVSQKNNETLSVKIGASAYEFKPIGENLFQLNHNGAVYIVAAIKSKGIYYIDIDSTVIEVHETGSTASISHASTHAALKDKVFAPMPGKIVKIMVNVGDKVAAKQPLAVVEAMKMENQINSPASGKVKAVNFTVGSQVNTTTPIIELDLE